MQLNNKILYLYIKTSYCYNKNVRGKMVAEIILNSNAKELNRVFDYNIPETMVYKAMVGSRVFVQFGNRKQLEEGFIIGIKESSEFKL